ncbi:cysteine synthase A [Candidatus Peregrinibacteria bacterium]|nr:MAG: cysteine synthase A [Candidatus Peregrinibacteria bacterium]
MLLSCATDSIGNTPLIRLSRFFPQGNILGKLESQNPGGSIKDRIALAMIIDAEERGILLPGGTVVEPTSGNTGIGLAFVCATRGYKCILTMPESMSMERRKMTNFFGAQLIITPAEEGMRGAILKAEEIAQEKDVFYPNQFRNPINPKIHEKTTGSEIWKDTKGKVDIFVAGVGTGGTITGVGRFLQKQNPDIQLIAVEPEKSPVLSGGDSGGHGIQGIGAGFVPKILDISLLFAIETISEEEAIATSQELAKKEGFCVGISTGANVAIAKKYAEENPEKTVVTILCDTGERYLSTELFG